MISVLAFVLSCSQDDTGQEKEIPDHIDNSAKSVESEEIDTNNSQETDCLELDNITLSADLTGIGIDSVWVSYTTNGTKRNKTTTKGTGNRYSRRYGTGSNPGLFRQNH